jgi:outer membrane protein assembly factor BamB
MRSVIRAGVFLSSAFLAILAATRAVTSAGGIDVVTYHNDVARTGQNLNETILTPASVTVAQFGKVGFYTTDGKVDAQPLLLSGVAIPGQGTHNVLYVATEHDSVYAFDAEVGTVLWRVSLLGAGESTSDARGCGQVVPEIGITSTPVIDRSRNAIYVVAMSRNGSGAYFQRLHALDVTSGAELFGGPRLIQASVTGTGAGSSGGTLAFDAKQYEERAGLLLINGRLITAWTSHCDIDPYTGWIMAYDPATLAQTSVINVTPNGSRGAFWMAGAGPAADPAANIYLLDGNGTFDTTLDARGFPNRGNFGNAFLKISTVGSLSVADYFATFDTVSQSNADRDLGSGGTLVLPDLVDGSGQTRHLAVGAGKDAHIYVVDRDSMGKWNASANLIYQDIAGALSGGVFSMPAYFNRTLYYGAAGDSIKAFPITNARVATASASRTARAFSYPGSTPGISASGTSNAILWAVENANPAVLHAYDARDLSHELYNSTQAAGSRDAFGAGNKFITPTIANGRVYVGTQTGVAAFGLTIPSAPTNLRILPGL